MEAELSYASQYQNQGGLSYSSSDGGGKDVLSTPHVLDVRLVAVCVEGVHRWVPPHTSTHSA